MEQPLTGTVVELHYTLTCDDVIAFNLHHLSTSKTARKSRRRVFLWLAGSFTALMVIILRDQLSKGSGLVPAFAIMVPFAIPLAIFLIIYPRYYRWHIRRYVRQAWSEGKNKALAGEQALKADEEALQTSSEFAATRMNWELVERVDVLEHYIFVYISAFNALILPRSTFASGSKLIEFLQLVGRRAGVPVKCPNCQYNLMGSQDGRCPECGYPEPKTI
jgi:hypothetical protein